MPNPSLPLVADTAPECSPGPVPTQIAAGTTVVGGKTLVVLQVSTPAGVSMVFLPPAMARDVAAAIEKSAVTAETGLVIVQDASLPAGSHGLRGSDVQFGIGRAGGSRA